MNFPNKLKKLVVKNIGRICMSTPNNRFNTLKPLKKRKSGCY